jgi:hypothetical protein
MSEENKDMKASLIFMCAMHENPIVEIEKLSSIKVAGMFIPAVSCIGTLETGQHYPVRFPIAALEAHNEQQLEELRKSFHTRIDKAIDDYKKNWPLILENRKKAALRSITSLKKKKEATDAPRDEPKEDDVGKEGNS